MRRWRQLLKLLPVHLVVIALAAIWLTPSLGLLVSSFRPRQDLLASGWWTTLVNPSYWPRFTLDNYRDVLFRQGMGRAFLNSFIITVPTTLITLSIAALAAYALAWMNFRGRQLLLMTVIGLIVIPLQMTLIPVLRMFNALKISGTFPGVWLAHTGYGLPLMIYLLRNFFGALPRELFESAFIDGASPFTAFLRLTLPLSVPVLASAAIFQFLWVWNDLLVSLVYLGGFARVAPLTVQLSNLVGSRGQDWHLLTAAAFVSMIVPMIVFFSLQRYFVRGILAGALKG
ncbi:MAG: carbohydrate ABC transporter permease [Candidatus Acetothermia bacterium]|jgi:alpha-glucoside transport system permease protein|nr:carbohydrate ABC transporter permease [Candidatus Acetothermia bacterium]